MLKDGQMSRPDTQEVEPLPRRILAMESLPRCQPCACLHDNKVHKVDGTSYVELGGVVVRVNVTGEVPKREPYVEEGDAVALEIPVRHGEGQYRLEDADEPVSLDNELPVYQPVLAYYARLAQEHIRLRGFVG